MSVNMKTILGVLAIAAVATAGGDMTEDEKYQKYIDEFYGSNGEITLLNGNRNPLVSLTKSYVVGDEIVWGTRSVKYADDGQGPCKNELGLVTTRGNCLQIGIC